MHSVLTSNIKDTVTILIIKAELLALTQAAKESIFIFRLIKQLSVTLDDLSITIQYNNT